MRTWLTLTHMSSSPARRDASVTFKTTIAGLAEIDRIANEEERDRSAMIRILLKEAVTARAKRKS